MKKWCKSAPFLFYNSVTFKNSDVQYFVMIKFYLQGDGTTWEIHLGTRLRVKVVPPNIFNCQCISAEWPVIFEKNAFEILRSPYVLLN